MKKASLILGIGVLTLTSCSNDEVINRAPDQLNGEQAAMQFNVRRGNISRAEQTLDNVAYDFGVWAYKGDDATDAATGTTNKIMEDYLVGFADVTKGAQKGYIPNAGQKLYGTSWYYEGLGYDQNSFDWGASSAAAFASKTSSQKEQFLKYWDAGKTYTWFYAYAPYIGKDAASRVTFTNGEKPVMLFPKVNSTTGASMMYASTKVTNAEMISQAKKVDLKFVRLGAQIRMAFYGEIPGYDIELVDLGPSNEGVIAVPSKPTEGDPNVYESAEYMVSAQPKITFSDGAVEKIEYITDAGSKSSANIVCIPTWFNSASDYSGAWNSTKITANKIYGATYDVLPSPTDNDCGFTLNVSFKLTAKYTGEVIYVRGARVFVPAQYCTWAPNTLYTYVFHITPNVPGNTGDNDPAPSVTPTINPALWPIVFENVIVDDIRDHEEVVEII